MSNSSIVGLLKVLLTADTAQFYTEMKRVSSSAQTWQKDLASVGRQATALGSSLTKTLTLPIVGLGVASLKAAIDFETAFAGVRKTVDATEPEFAALAQGFRDLSKQIPINVNELARLGEAAGALGIRKADIQDFSRVMALLGVTTNVTSEQAAESIAKIQNIFGAAGKDTQRFASTLVALGNDGASTEQDILALASRIASAGNTVKISQGQVLGFSAAIANVGMEAEAGGSAMSRVFIDIARAVSTGGKAVQGFADVTQMSVEKFSDLFKRDASAATLAFVQGLDRIQAGGGDLTKTLDGLGFTELRQSDLLRRLAGDSAGLKSALDLQSKAWRENTALTEEARKRFETTESQLTLLWNRVKDVGITIGNALLPTIKSLVSVLGAMMPVLEGAAKLFTILPQPIQLGVLALLAVTAAAGPAIFAFGQLALAASALTGAFAANGLASRVFTANLGFLVVGLRSSVVAAAATTTAYGAMGAASILATSAVRGLWAAMVAHPAVAVAAGIGLVTAALVKLQEQRKIDQQSALVTTYKAETIARAEQAGVILKAADATGRYLEAVTALQQIEDIRQATVNKSLDAQKRGLEAELALGRVSRDTYNARLLMLSGEERAAEVQKKRVTISEASAAAERAIQLEIAATGYTVKELTTALKANEVGFNAWAEAVELSAATRAFLKAQIKEGTVATKEATKAFDELKERQDRLFGRDLIARAQEMVADLGDLANVSKLLPDMQASMLKGVDEAIAAYRQLGQAVPASLSGVRDVLVPLVAANTLAANVETNINAILYRLGQLGMKVGLLFPSLRTTAFDPGMITGATSVTLKAPKLMSMFGADLKNAVTQFSRLLGPTILQALTGGGSVSQSIGGLAGMQIGNSLSATFGGVVKKNLGEKIGGAFASFLPGIGALIGPLIGKGLAKLGSLLGFGPSELDKVREARGEWLKAQGGLEKLHKTLGAVAGDAKVRAAWAELFNAKNVKDYEAALARFNTTVSEAQTTLNARLADEQDAREFLQATVEKYGFTIDQLGQKWKKQALADQAELLIREYTALTASGIDHNLVIERMGANLQEFLQTAIRTGAEVPEQMRPLLRQLIETGSLIDENGNAFSLGALDAVNWSKTLTENIQLVVNKLDELIRTITERLGKAIEEIPPLEIPLSPRDTFLTRNRGGNKFPALASGGIVMQPTLAMLGESGPEAVVPLRAGGGGFGSQTIILEVDGMVMARASVPYIPGELRRLRLA